MRKLYKREKGRLCYREVWVDGTSTTIHHGVVGRRGEVERGELVGSASAFEKRFVSDARSKGYLPIPTSEMFSLVVQYPMKSAMGNERDRWLLEKASRCLDEGLGWRGLGHVDGNDFGSGESPAKTNLRRGGASLERQPSPSGVSSRPAESASRTARKVSASAAFFARGRFASACIGMKSLGLSASTSRWRSRKAQYMGVSGHVVAGSKRHPPQ